MFQGVKCARELLRLEPDLGRVELNLGEVSGLWDDSISEGKIKGGNQCRRPIRCSGNPQRELAVNIHDLCRAQWPSWAAGGVVSVAER